MNQQQYESLLRYLSEERAHLKFKEDAVELNTYTGDIEFTHHANKYIRAEEGVLEITFEQFGFKPKQSLLDRLKCLFN
jgi:hypothetical protein|tara:strand:+ start:510 stop:743 length:234 start_codon:yes stop_codon:yes gene_type:complete